MSRGLGECHSASAVGAVQSRSQTRRAYEVLDAPREEVPKLHEAVVSCAGGLIRRRFNGFMEKASTIAIKCLTLDKVPQFFESSEQNSV